MFSEHPVNEREVSDVTLLIALLIAAMVFGVGAVVEGLAWAMVVAIALLLTTVLVGVQVVGRGRRRTSRTA